jgi:outer membrane immunogenic protein
MNRISRSGIALSALLGSAAFTAAGAADMPVKAAPLPPAPVTTWTGWYVGGNAGAGWADGPFNSSPGGTLLTAPFFGSPGWGATSTGSGPAGFTGGLELGYNYQINAWVIGAETDFGYFGAVAKNSNTYSPAGGATVTNSLSSKTPWIGTARIRIGTTMGSPNFLVYGTGGLAYGQEQLSGTIGATAPGLTELFSFSQTQTMLGWTAGAGAAWALNDHWSVKVEYLHIEFDNQSQTVPPSVIAGPNAFPTDAMTLEAAYRLDVVRAGLDYKF